MLKRYNEVFNTVGLISTMKKVDVTKFNDIFGEDYDNELLDDFILFNIGNCWVTEEVETVVSSDINKLAKFAWLRFYDSWKTLLKTLAVDYTKSYGETINKDTTRNTKENSQNNTTINNKVFAYDSETASNDSIEDNTTDHELNNDNTENIIQTKSGYNYGSTLMDLIKKYYEYNIENTFVDVVIGDIVKLTTYSII